ncbi:DUF4209 domain-containing protein [Bacillus sp. 95MFCvi2.1]|uniref:DUF4209 domain-containing protein n=1 Tax=Bacillus sp. 95MFCvi2.1 TaxID=1151121 RepID=UPI00037F10BB|nr:DUF4209 domain-containing protein [Bacillus sp. 95MFCvi2.1]
MINISLTKEDFLETNWQEIISSEEITENHNYSHSFYKAMQDARDNGDEKKAYIFKLLGDVTSYGLDLDSKDNHFTPFWIMDGKRSASIEDLKESELSFFEEIVEEIDNPEIKSRIADVLWIRQKNYKRAILAISSYIEVYEQMINPDSWYAGIERLERAVQLASLFKKGEIRKSIIEKVEEEIEKHKIEKESFIVNSLIKLLLKLKRFDLEKHIEILEERAVFEEEREYWSRAREYWNLCIECLTYEKRFNEREEAKLSSANTYVMEAEMVLRDNPTYFIAVSHLQSAIEAYRRIEGTTETVNNLHRRMLEYQKKSVSQMQEFESEGIDISELIENSINEVKGKSFNDKLVTLALMYKSLRTNELRETAEAVIRKSPLRHIMTSAKVNSEGKIIGKSPSVLSDSTEDYEEAIKIEMYNNAGYHRQAIVEAIIEPVRKQVLLEHFIMLRHLAPLVINNPFIPEGREEIFAKGLYYGLHGDFLISAHLLIPQIENSIRFILSKEEEIVSNIDKDGIQEEKNLNTLLYLPKLKELWGEDFVFDLQSLLVEKHGDNLRNTTSHGLIGNNEFYSVSTIYLWWLTLKLCIMYKIQ